MHIGKAYMEYKYGIGLNIWIQYMDFYMDSVYGFKIWLRYFHAMYASPIWFPYMQLVYGFEIYI